MTETSSRPIVAFLNMRRTPTEQTGPLQAALRSGAQVMLIADSVPEGLSQELVTTQRAVPSTFDTNRVLQVIEEELDGRQLAGVVTWSDAAVETVAAIGAAHGIPTVSPEAARICRDKGLMRQALASRRPDMCPKFARVSSWEETLDASGTMAYPLVLKPVSGSGSKGIYRVEDEDSLRAAHQALKAFVDPRQDPIFTGHGGDLILEEFLAGTEHSVEGVVHDGVVSAFGVTDKRTNEPYRLETGHIFPSQLPAEVLASVGELVHETISSFGLDNTAFHLECIIGADGHARLVECAARGAGDFIMSDLVGLATGVPGCLNVLRVALGKEPLPTSPHLVAGVRKIMASKPGTLSQIVGLDDALRVAGVEKVVLERPIGARVQLPPDDFSSSVIGAVIATAPTAAEAEAILDTATGLIGPVLE